jgi:hypothetical protein
MPTIRRTIIIIRMGTTCGRTILIPNNTRIITRAPHITGITDIEFTTVTTVIIITTKVPAKPQWCETLNTVFSWTRTRFPFHTSSAKKLTLDQPRRQSYRQGIFRCRSFS